MSKPKRAELPGASELFRPTRPAPETTPPAETPQATPAAKTSPAVKTSSAAKTALASAPEPAAAQPDEVPIPAPTGRVRHDHKITVYFSEDELLALEDANLDLRRAHGIRVDRGRIVRVAVAHAVADLIARGADSDLVSELKQQ